MTYIISPAAAAAGPLLKSGKVARLFTVCPEGNVMFGGGAQIIHLSWLVPTAIANDHYQGSRGNTLVLFLEVFFILVCLFFFFFSILIVTT